MVPISFAPASVPESILSLIGSEISREQIEALSDDGVESFQYVPAGSIVQNSLTDLFDVQTNDGLVGKVLAEDVQEGKNKVHKAGTKITETLLGRLINNAKIRSLPIQEGDETASVELQMLTMTPIGQQVLGHRILGVTSTLDLSSSIGRTVSEESLRDLFARDRNASILTYDPAKAAGYELFRVNGSLAGQTLAEDVQLRKPKAKKLAVGQEADPRRSDSDGEERGEPRLGSPGSRVRASEVQANEPGHMHQPASGRLHRRRGACR